MPTNALIVPYVQGQQAQVVLPLKDPRPERLYRSHYVRDHIPQLELANSLYCPAGKWPTRAWVCVGLADYNLITNKYATNFQLNFTSVDKANKTSVTFQNLSIVQAWGVSTGLPGDVDTVYLVELTDARGLVESPWFQFPTTSQYNANAPAYPGQYYSQTTNGGTPWTWDGMVGDLWGQMPLLGTYPGLPSAPTGTPTRFLFPGVSCWRALNRILDLLSMQIAVNPASGSPYTIVNVGSADVVLSGLQAQFKNKLEDDYQYIDVGAGRIPGSVTVYFHRINQYYGTEETVRDDSLQWSTTPQIGINVVGPAQFSSAPGTGFLWDDFQVRYDADGNILPADAATALTIADERVAEWYNRAYRGTLGYLYQRYTGCLPFLTGSLIDGVVWKMAEKGQGFTTTIVRGPQPPFPEAA